MQSRRPPWQGEPRHMQQAMTERILSSHLPATAADKRPTARQCDASRGGGGRRLAVCTCISHLLQVILMCRRACRQGGGIPPRRRPPSKRAGHKRVCHVAIPATALGALCARPAGRPGPGPQNDALPRAPHSFPGRASPRPPAHACSAAVKNAPGAATRVHMAPRPRPPWLRCWSVLENSDCCAAGCPPAGPAYAPPPSLLVLLLMPLEPPDA